MSHPTSPNSPDPAVRQIAQAIRHNAEARRVITSPVPALAPATSTPPNPPTIQVVELAPRVRPASGLNDGAVTIQGVIPAEGIGLQDSLVASQMFPRSLTFAVGRVAIPDRWRRTASCRPVVPYIGPQTRRARLSAPRLKNRNRCVVGMYLVRIAHVTAERIGHAHLLTGSKTSVFNPPARELHPRVKRWVFICASGQANWLIAP